MTKLNVARELKDILNGVSEDTVAQIYKIGNHWNIETDINSNNFDYIKNSIIYRDDGGNRITLKQTINLLNNDF